MNGLAQCAYLMRILTLDPVHVGIGQDVMGEVDLPVDREKETNVPRIPGSTLKGGFRSNARWKLRAVGRYPPNTFCPGDNPAPEGEEKEQGRSLCGVTDCPICQTFGWGPYLSNGSKVKGNEGRVTFRDARLAFFPAATNKGTVWFSTPGRAAAYLAIGPQIHSDTFYQQWPELIFGMGACGAICESFSSLQVAWLNIQALPLKNLNGPVKSLVEKLKDSNCPGLIPDKMWRDITQRTVLLDETNFYRVVESCLERRTCNRIDDITGTVAEKALFSYEAIPRGSLLYARMDVGNGIKVNGITPLDVCDHAREGLARMGIGGLQTRGLGSILVEFSKFKFNINSDAEQKQYRLTESRHKRTSATNKPGRPK